jgi:hypothetical protein
MRYAEVVGVTLIGMAGCIWNMGMGDDNSKGFAGSRAD